MPTTTSPTTSAPSRRDARVPSTSPPIAWLESPDGAYRVRVALDPNGRAVALLPAPRRSLVPERVPAAPLVMREERETVRPEGGAA
jgi:hypothetical protein